MRSPVRHTIASACLWTVSGCATTDQLAPPVDERTIALAGVNGLDRETLEGVFPDISAVLRGEGVATP